MAYIKKEPIVEFITKGLNNPDNTKAFGYDAIEILTEIEYAPTADVVPKSEVEKLKTYIDDLNDSKEHLAVMLTEAESEVAMKIFARVRKVFYDVSFALDNEFKKAVLNNDKYAIDLISGEDEILRNVRRIIEEFAKEYTHTSPGDPKEAFIKKLVDNWEWGKEE